MERDLITLDLAEGETYPLLVNALSAYADVLHRQSQEQDTQGRIDYSRFLRGTAEEAEQLIGRITAAKENRAAD